MDVVLELTLLTEELELELGNVTGLGFPLGSGWHDLPTFFGVVPELSVTLGLGAFLDSGRSFLEELDPLAILSAFSETFGILYSPATTVISSITSGLFLHLPLPTMMFVFAMMIFVFS